MRIGLLVVIIVLVCLWPCIGLLDFVGLVCLKSLIARHFDKNAKNIFFELRNFSMDFDQKKNFES